MSNILADLANHVRKSDSVSTPKPQRQVRNVALANTQPQPLVKSGPGGTVFNFSNRYSGNPIVDSYNAHLQHHADPEQHRITQSQHHDVSKALNRFVDIGEDAYNVEQMNANEGPGVAKGWDEQLSGSTDQQVAEAFKKGILDVNETQSHPSGGGELPSGKFSKSEISMGGQSIKATSETDAAIIEMMKGGALDDEFGK